ncbi:MAG: hypothetical protein BWY77_00479 [bacterium ADurb.Bin431]|nr:MAG: hypothetical protein BWY77_00479 [bacterium ADurb.Bin431]
MDEEGGQRFDRGREATHLDLAPAGGQQGLVAMEMGRRDELELVVGLLVALEFIKEVAQGHAGVVNEGADLLALDRQVADGSEGHDGVRDLLHPHLRQGEVVLGEGVPGALDRDPDQALFRVGKVAELVIGQAGEVVGGIGDRLGRGGADDDLVVFDAAVPLFAVVLDALKSQQGVGLEWAAQILGDEVLVEPLRPLGQADLIEAFGQGKDHLVAFFKAGIEVEQDDQIAGRFPIVLREVMAPGLAEQPFR